MHSVTAEDGPKPKLQSKFLAQRLHQISHRTEPCLIPLGEPFGDFPAGVEV